MQYIKNNLEVEVKNYPYGFTLKTSLFDTVEFNSKKGYRHVTQTINPKNGVKNKPKKSVYYPLMVRYYNEGNHIKTKVFSFNGDEDINKGLKFMFENFNLFSIEEIKYIYSFIFISLKVSTKASVIYGGANFEDLKPLFSEVVDNIVKGINNPIENFFNVSLDIEKINNCKPKDFNPFR